MRRAARRSPCERAQWVRPAGLSHHTHGYAMGRAPSACMRPMDMHAPHGDACTPWICMHPMEMHASPAPWLWHRSIIPQLVDVRPHFRVSARLIDIHTSAQTATAGYRGAQAANVDGIVDGGSSETNVLLAQLGSLDLMPQVRARVRPRPRPRPRVRVRPRPRPRPRPRVRVRVRVRVMVRVMVRVSSWPR